MANKKYLVGILAMVLIFALTAIGCDTGGGGGGGEQQPPTPLQQAINWANEDTRRWQMANCSYQEAFNTPHSNEHILCERTFIQFVEDTLTNAWNETYRHNPSAWNTAKWKEIIGNAFNPANSHFASNELPLIIS